MDLEFHTLREGDAYKWDSGKRTIGTGAKLEIGITTGDNVVHTSLLFCEHSQL